MNGELKSKLNLQENLLKGNIDLKNSVLKLCEEFAKMEAQHDKIDTQEERPEESKKEHGRIRLNN